MFYISRIFLLLVVFFIFDFQVFANALEKIPSSLILIPDNGNAILVQKKSQQLFLYTNKGKISKDFQFFCSTGKVYGDKKKSGDKKTPEGVYFIKDIYEDKDLSAIYGKKAFPIDYPNFVDKAAGKSGNNIWLHGTNKVLKAMDSNGCVAMEDNDILSLSEYITINKTPIIIVDTLSLVDKEELSNKMKMIIKWLKDWKNAINLGTYREYLNLYDSSYLPDIFWWKNWYAIRNETRKSIGSFNVVTSDQGIYEQGNIFVLIFNLSLKLNKQHIDLGIRKLFLVEKDNSYKVIGDVYQDKKITVDPKSWTIC